MKQKLALQNGKRANNNKLNATTKVQFMLKKPIKIKGINEILGAREVIVI